MGTGDNEDSDTELVSASGEESEMDDEGAELLDLAEDVGLVDLYHGERTYIEEECDDDWYVREVCSSPVK